MTLLHLGIASEFALRSTSVTFFIRLKNGVKASRWGRPLLSLLRGFTVGLLPPVHHAEQGITPRRRQSFTGALLIVPHAACFPPACPSSLLLSQPCLHFGLRPQHSSYELVPADVQQALLKAYEEAYGEPAWLDAGYAGMEDVVKAKHMTPIICEKGRRGHPLTDEQKESNRQKSKVRSRVEHVFGFMEQTMGGLIFRGVGMIRAKANIAMTNLVYNMCRLVQIKKYQPNLIAIQ